MNIYFALSITGGRKDEAIYQKIVAALLADGHEVPTAMLAQSNITSEERVVDPIEVYQRDTSWIRACDLLIAEVSTPSHGVGYEIGYALNLGKPVLCLHRQDSDISKMISGNRDPSLVVRTYINPQNAIKILRQFLKEMQG
ncbi:MAG: nucleoside 2-deoxyribosyltransferase [Chloroflexi bacterium]|nr:nucleoside 2-deoxyribosyltransferase [Chloroflexota bacterium]